MTKFQYHAELARNRQLLRSVERMLGQEQRAGSIPTSREGPTGDEQVIYAGLAVEPIGFATFFHVGGGRVWLDLLIVRKEFRSRGIGRQLFEEVRRRAGEQEHATVELGTMADNTVMQRLVGSIGLAPAGLLYAVPSVRNIPPGADALRSAAETINKMTAEQQSQAHALRQQIKRLHRQQQAREA